jgi:NADPH:quinone reductase-like Zn-dependent oxidoreductase
MVYTKYHINPLLLWYSKQLNTMATINKLQRSMITSRSKELRKDFVKEVHRLINSGAVSPDKDGYYPISMIFKVALENEAGKWGVSSKSDYKNLQKF